MADEQKKSDGSGWFVLIAIAALLWFTSGRQAPGPGPSPGPSVEGGLLLLVLEGRSPTAEQELLLRSAPDAVTTHKLSGFRKLDDDLSEVQPLIAAVKSQFNVEPPFMAVQKSRALIRAAPMTDSAGLEKFLK